MNELVLTKSNIPVTTEDLARFVLVGTEKLKAVKAEIAAIQKIGLAKDVYEQKKQEAQEIAEAVQLASVQVGKILNAMPKASGGNHGNQHTGGKNHSEVKFAKIEHEVDFGTKPKMQAVKEMGFTQKQAEQFQQMAKHEDTVKQAIQKARDNDDIVSRAFVMNEIQKEKMPIAQNSGNNERYTPGEYIEAARKAMGSIDLDPASSALANETVQAARYYTAEDDGLLHEWGGNIWLNPPYAKDLIGKFADKLTESDFSQAIILVHNATETKWFARFISRAAAVVFPTGRIDCKTPGDNPNTPLQGSAFIYCGDNPQRFLDVFLPFGWGARLSDTEQGEIQSVHRL